MTAHPKVSVIIPTYNHAAYVGIIQVKVLTRTSIAFSINSIKKASGVHLESAYFTM